MAKLYNVSIINKYDIWLKEDEENPINWAVMSKEQLEKLLQKQLIGKEKIKGRLISGYEDIVWRKFV